jgi:hypothetical protein
MVADSLSSPSEKRSGPQDIAQSPKLLPEKKKKKNLFSEICFG